MTTYTYTTLNDPLATGGTVASGINDSGQIVGYYNDSSGAHGFVAKPAAPFTSDVVPAQTDATIQSTSTGAVDFLQFTGTTLTASDMQNYGLTADFRIVASGDFNNDGSPDLVAQNVAGQVDILNLDANHNLISTTLVNSALPQIVGQGQFFSGSPVPTLATQLGDGSLDMVQLDQFGHFVASDLVPGTAGLPQAVGVAAGAQNNAAFALPATNTDSVATQLANGAVDLIGFNGSFGNLTFAASDLTQTAGLGPVGDVNTDFVGGHASQTNVYQPPVGLLEGRKAISSSPWRATASSTPPIRTRDTAVRLPRACFMLPSCSTSPSRDGTWSMAA